MMLTEDFITLSKSIHSNELNCMREPVLKSAQKGLVSFKKPTMHTKQRFNFDWNEHELQRPITTVTTIEITCLLELDRVTGKFLRFYEEFYL